VSAKVIEFMSTTNELGITLNKEQLCKLVLETYGSVLEVTPPYQRIEGLSLVASLEQKTARMLG
jgi:hypothetical protein